MTGRAHQPPHVDCRDVLYIVRKLTFRGEEPTRAGIAAELQLTNAAVTTHLLHACASGLLRMTRRPAASAKWSLTEDGERALSAHLLRLHGTRPRPPKR